MASIFKESKDQKFNLKDENGRYLSIKDFVIGFQDDEEYYESATKICKELLGILPDKVFSIFATDGMDNENSYNEFVNSILINSGRNKVKSMEDMYGGVFTLFKNDLGDLWIENYPEGAGSPDLWIPEKMLKKYTD